MKVSVTARHFDLTPELKERAEARLGRFGKFAACSQYPECKYTQPIQIKTGVKCPDCPEGGELVGRYNRRGQIFYGCSAYPKHKFAINYPPSSNPCPNCGGLVIEIHAMGEIPENGSSGRNR